MSRSIGGIDPEQRLQFELDALDAYAKWVPQNLDRIRRHSKNCYANLPPHQWNKMYGLDLFCEEHGHLVEPFYKLSPTSKTQVTYFRESISRRAGMKSKQLTDGEYGRTFPGLLERKQGKSYVATTVKSRKKKSKVRIPKAPATVYANAVDSDPISQALDTNFAQANFSLQDFFTELTSSGAKSFTVNF